MNNYVLAQSWAQANIQDRVWYCMEETDKYTLLEEQKILFGDKCYVIKSQKAYIMGNDNTWYSI